MGESVMVEQLKQLPDSERKLHLQAMACKVEEGTFFKKFTEEEIGATKDAYTDMQIELGDAEEQLADLCKELRDKVKQLRSRNKSTLQNIRQGGCTVMGITYFIADQEAGKMLQVDERGEVVNSRRLRPEEKQMNSFTTTINKKVSNG